MHPTQRPILALTLGDPAGVGPEIILKTLQHEAVYAQCRPLVIGDRRILERAAQVVGGPFAGYDLVRRPEQGHYEPGRVVLIDLHNADPAECPVGEVRAASGRAAVEAVFAAADLAMAGEAAAVVTAPLNKAAMSLAGFEASGHTELLAARTGARDVSMLLVGDRLRVIHVSTHVALAEAIRRVTAAIGTAEAPMRYMLGEKYITAMGKLADSQNAKTVIIPADWQETLRGVLGRDRG